MARITDLAIKALKPRPQRYEHAIGDRLFCEVHPTGRRRFTYRYALAGKRHKITFEPGLTLAAARLVASEMSLELERGIDPKAARQARQAPAADPDTLGAVVGEYFQRVGDKLRTAKRARRMLATHILPDFGERSISSIKRSEIIRALDRVEDRHGAAMADAVLALLRKVMGFHTKRADDFHSPIVRGMARLTQREHARSQILTDDELRAIWTTAEDAGAFGGLLRFLLLTGARVNEAARMTRAELTGELWTLPAERNKTKVVLERPLSGAARAVLAGLPQLGAVYVFTSDGVRPLGGFSRRKPKFDANCGVTGWTLHDLRRTARSLMSRAGVVSDHAERCLGHILPGVRGVYDRHRYVGEMQHAYEALAAQIDRIIDPRDNVTALPTRR